MLGFLAGLFIGGAVGVLAVCLCIAAGDADRAEGLRRRENGKRPRS